MAKALEGNKSIRVLFLIIFFPMKWPALYFSQVLVITSGIPHLGRWPLDLTVQFSSKSCFSYHTMLLKHPNHTWQKWGAITSINIFSYHNDKMLHQLEAYLAKWCLKQAWFTLNIWTGTTFARKFYWRWRNSFFDDWINIT